MKVLEIPADEVQEVIHQDAAILRTAGWPTDRAIEITNKMDEWICMAVADINLALGYAGEARRRLGASCQRRIPAAIL